MYYIFSLHDCQFRTRDYWLILGPVHTYPDIFESATFSFRIRLPSTRIRRIRQGIRKKINPLSRVEKNKSETNPITCGRVNPDIFESEQGRKEQISRHYLPLRRMLWRLFSAEEPWVLEWIWIPSDACGRANTLRVDEEIFESGKKKLRIPKYPVTCGRGFRLPKTEYKNGD